MAPKFTRLCDRCGRPLQENELRYVARIEVFAAPTTLEISAEDLERDRTDEIAGLLSECEGMSAEDLMRDVHVEFKYDLCRPCQRAYIRAPLPPIGDVG